MEEDNFKNKGNRKNKGNTDIWRSGFLEVVVKENLDMNWVGYQK